MGIHQIPELKILHLESTKYSESALKTLSEIGELHCLEINSQEALEEHLHANQYEVIVTRLGLMLDASLLQGQGNLKYIMSSTTGLNHIDMEYCLNQGIEIISLKGELEFLASIKSTAEHTWMLLLAIARNFSSSFQEVLNGFWKREPFMADELDNKTLGIIGYGRLGRILARYAQAFGMKVLIHDRIQIDTSELNGAISVGLDELLRDSDFISLLISYSPENKNFINEQAFQKMKSGVYFINTSRGEMVDEAALLRNLENGHVKGAALDVLDGDSAWSEHPDADHPLLQYAQMNENLLLTPHMGGYGIDSIRKTRDFVTNKLLNRINS